MPEAGRGYLQVFRSASLQVCESASLQVCKLAPSERAWTHARRLTQSSDEGSASLQVCASSGRWALRRGTLRSDLPDVENFILPHGPHVCDLERGDRNRVARACDELYLNGPTISIAVNDSTQVARSQAELRQLAPSVSMMIWVRSIRMLSGVHE